MNKIKILFTVPNFITAGSGREMFNIVERLDKNIFEPWVAVETGGGKLFDEIIKKGYPIMVQPFIVRGSNNIIDTVLKSRSLAEEFKKQRFDIWQSFNWSSDFSEALVARAAGAKYVYVKKNMNWGRKAWTIKSILSKTIVARNTTLLETYFASKKFKKKTVFITGGVQVDRFKPNTPTNIREELNIPQDAFLLSCIAQLTRTKDQLSIVHAVSKVENTYAVLAGAIRDEKYHQELKNLISSLGVSKRVIIPGSVSNVNELLNATNAFVLPTTKRGGHEEGCPVALMEAMAAGTPCIGSDVGGTRDLIKHGETGLLFKADSLDGFVDCIREFVSKPSYAKSMADRAYKIIHAKHTLEIETKAFASMYLKMVKG